MGWIELFVVALLATGGASAAAVLIGRRRRRRAEAAPPPPDPAVPAERGVADLRPGDVVLLDGSDYLVTGVARFDPASPWVLECRTDGGGQETWLVVCGGRDGAVLFGTPVAGLTLSDPPSVLLDHGGDVFRLDRRGPLAAAAAEGDLVADYPGGPGWFFEYAQPGPLRLWGRRHGERVLVCAGQRVQRHMVTVLPGNP